MLAGISLGFPDPLPGVYLDLKRQAGFSAAPSTVVIMSTTDEFASMYTIELLYTSYWIAKYAHNGTELWRRGEVVLYGDVTTLTWGCIVVHQNLLIIVANIISSAGFFTVKANAQTVYSATILASSGTVIRVNLLDPNAYQLYIACEIHADSSIIALTRHSASTAIGFAELRTNGSLLQSRTSPYFANLPLSKPFPTIAVNNSYYISGFASGNTVLVTINIQNLLPIAHVVLYGNVIVAKLILESDMLFVVGSFKSEIRLGSCAIYALGVKFNMFAAMLDAKTLNCVWISGIRSEFNQTASVATLKNNLLWITGTITDDSAPIAITIGNKTLSNQQKNYASMVVVLNKWSGRVIVGQLLDNPLPAIHIFAINGTSIHTVSAKSSETIYFGYISCPRGSFSTFPVDVCTLCSPGYYSSTIGSETCSSCTTGTFSQLEGSTSCAVCPLGTFQPTYNVTSMSGCYPCPQGSFAEKRGLDVCRKCPKGTYSVITGSVSQANCLACEPGFYNPIDGASQCSPCGAGYVTNETASIECKECPAGHFSKLASSTCNICRVGTFSASSGHHPVKIVYLEHIMNEIQAVRVLNVFLEHILK